MQVSILYAFVAGIISFLSPCVLPLVPGYVSMLSGIGVEQLRTGQPARNSLFASSLAFVSRIFGSVHQLSALRPARWASFCCSTKR